MKNYLLVAAMHGEKDLKKILHSLQPVLHDGDYVFCTVANADDLPKLEIIAFFREQEGLTLILKKESADRLQLAYSFVAAWITLSVYSSLEAVGLTAAVSAALAEEGISCNVVAAYYHDHIFVAREDAERAMITLIGLTSAP